MHVRNILITNAYKITVGSQKCMPFALVDEVLSRPSPGRVQRQVLPIACPTGRGHNYNR
jgi:hypothetical protein